MTVEQIIEGVLEREAGFQADANDKGNWTGGAVGAGELKGTNFGISAAAFPHLDIKNLTREQAFAIYREEYVTKPGFEQIPDPSLREQLVDFGVNSGPARAIEFLQKLLQVEVTRKLDGPTLSTLWSLGPLCTFILNDALAGVRAAFIDKITDANARLKKFEEGLESRALEFIKSDDRK